MGAQHILGDFEGFFKGQSAILKGFLRGMVAPVHKNTNATLILKD
jgi:hypothetical protein